MCTQWEMRVPSGLHGATWSTVDFRSSTDLNAVWGEDSDNIFVVGEGGSMGFPTACIWGGDGERRQ